MVAESRGSVLIADSQAVRCQVLPQRVVAGLLPLIPGSSIGVGHAGWAECRDRRLQHEGYTISISVM